jgi:membrane-associated protease RseP (regulator of RpoE activity)
MMKKYFAFGIAALCCMAFQTASIAQGKAKIYIKKNTNGTVTEETREIIINEGEDIQKILKEAGVLNGFGELQPGQEFEINIDKLDLDSSSSTLHFFFSPDAPIEMMPPPPAPLEKRPFLGVMLNQNYNMDNGRDVKPGARVTEVIEGTAAQEAGVMVGDVIVEIDQKKITSADDVIQYVGSKKPGDKVELKVLRDGKTKKIKANLGEKEMSAPRRRYSEERDMDQQYFEFPDLDQFNFRIDDDSITIFSPNDSMKICQPFSWNGEESALKESAFLGVTPGEENEAENGVKVNVENGTAAETMGLQNDDIITHINDNEVNSFDQLAEIIGAMEPGATVDINIVRDGNEKRLSGQLGKRTMSGFDDFRIFHDFKGMDEGGNYIYDYEFDMNEGNLKQHMQELLQNLDEQQLMLEEERSRIMEEMERMDQELETIVIKIRIDEISAQELEAVNKTASPKLSALNNLDFDAITFFPNPGNGVINLSFETKDKNNVSVTVYDAAGNKVYLEERKDFDGKYKNTIDITTQPNGAYYLQIIQGDKYYSKKIVKGL